MKDKKLTPERAKQSQKFRRLAARLRLRAAKVDRRAEKAEEE